MAVKYKAVKKIGRKRKEKLLNELIENLKNNKYFIIADLFKIRSKDLQEIRKITRDVIKLKVTRNTLIKLAIKKAYGEKVAEKLDKILVNQNAFIFTNINPFEIFLFLNKNKIYTFAKEGDLAQEDIIVPAGNTGLTPGPILSKFGKLKIPTKIEEGSIWITKDVTIAKKGEIINKEIAELLSLLGIKPIAVTLKLKHAFDGKNLIEKIYVDLEQIKKDLGFGYSSALNFAVNAKLPLKESLSILICEAQINSLKLTQQLAIPEKDMLKNNLQRVSLITNIIFEKLKEKGFS